MKRAKKRRRQPHCPNTYRDAHHILWPRTEWSKRSWAKTLRTHWYLRVLVPKTTLHKQIHHEIASVPVPKTVNIQSVLFQLKQLEGHGAIHQDDGIERRLRVVMSLFECCEQETFNALKKQYEIVRKFYEKTPH